MKILRSVTRRGFRVGTSGWFTVTTPARWFAASQFKEGPGTFVGDSKWTAARVVRDRQAIEPFGANSTIAPPQIAIPLSQDHRLLRLTMGALAATGFAYFMLGWIGGARP